MLVESSMNGDDDEPSTGEMNRLWSFPIMGMYCLSRSMYYQMINTLLNVQMRSDRQHWRISKTSRGV